MPLRRDGGRAVILQHRRERHVGRDRAPGGHNRRPDEQARRHNSHRAADPHNNHHEPQRARGAKVVLPRRRLHNGGADAEALKCCTGTT